MKRAAARLATGALLLVLCFGLALACGDSDGDDSERTVLTSIELFADMARHVAGDRAAVEALLPPGADAHTFELPPDRVADVARADVVLVNGLDLEGNVLDAIEENAGGPVVELSEGLDAVDGNPHLWLDARLAVRYVERIRDALIALDPDGRETYEANAAAYVEEIDTLDADFENAMQSVPAENRKLVTFHDAFPYLARRYGLEVVAVVVPSPGQEPSAQDVADLTETIESEGVPAVFKEPQFNNEVLERAADEAGVEVRELLSDAYSEDVDSYVELMRFDMEQLQEGLRGN